MFLISRGLWVLVVAWTLITGGSLFWTLEMDSDHIYSEAKARAVMHNRDDLEYRHWNSSHGGVYVPLTEKTRPNPYLSYLPDRDVTTTSGKKLTLVNPSYMTRQVHAMENYPGAIHSHIASLNPLRSENKPSAWEEKALRLFEQGESEFHSLEVTDDGKSSFRYMSSMTVEQHCLKCHAHQGAQVGDVLGGLSVEIPVDVEMAEMHEEMDAAMYAHGVLWFLGLSAIFLGGRMQAKAESELREREENFRNIFENASDALYLIDSETGQFFDCNYKAAEMTGYSIAEIKTMTVMNLHPEEEQSQLPEILKTVAEKGSLDGIIGLNHLRKDGVLVPTEVNATLIEIGGKKLNLSAVRDISERKKGADKLNKHVQELERFQAATIDREFRIKELRDEIDALKKGKE